MFSISFKTYFKSLYKKIDRRILSLNTSQGNSSIYLHISEDIPPLSHLLKNRNLKIADLSIFHFYDGTGDLIDHLMQRWNMYGATLL